MTSVHKKKIYLNNTATADVFEMYKRWSNFKIPDDLVPIFSLCPVPAS